MFLEKSRSCVHMCIYAFLNATEPMDLPFDAALIDGETHSLAWCCCLKWVTLPKRRTARKKLIRMISLVVIQALYRWLMMCVLHANGLPNTRTTDICDHFPTRPVFFNLNGTVWLWKRTSSRRLASFAFSVRIDFVMVKYSASTVLTEISSLRIANNVTWMLTKVMNVADIAWMCAMSVPLSESGKAITSRV